MRRIAFELKVARVYLFLLWERSGMARSLEGDNDKTKSDSAFAVTGAQSMAEQKLDMRTLLELCLSENDRRFAGYDQRLLRPTMMPSLVRRVLKLLPRHKPGAGPVPTA
jgi:hypothetical protein